MYDQRKPGLMDILFITIAALFVLFVLSGGGGGNTTNYNGSVQYNTLSAVNNGVVGANTSTTQQIAPTPAPAWSTDNAGNPMCWDDNSHMYVYSCGGRQP